MAIHNLFSKRQKLLRGEVADVYTYNTIPKSLRIQIVYLWKDCLGHDDVHYRGEKSFYKPIVEALCREYGLFRLAENSYGTRDYMKEIIDFFLQEEDTERVLDAIELSFEFATIFAHLSEYYPHRQIENPIQIVDNAIKELNTRFKEHGVGFQFEGSEIIRVDSQFIHSKAVKPALTLLQDKEYAGAQQEFLNAFDHYRRRKYKEALNDALKSFESTLKTICIKKGWAFDQKDTCKRLIDICYKNELIPKFWQHHMGALRSLLEGGVPTGRNKLSGHGQGSVPTLVPEHIASYVLHMTASAIVFLVRAEQSKK